MNQYMPLLQIKYGGEIINADVWPTDPNTNRWFGRSIDRPSRDENELEDKTKSELSFRAKSQILCLAADVKFVAFANPWPIFHPFTIQYLLRRRR